MRRRKTSAIRSPGEAGLPARVPCSFPTFLVHGLMYPRFIAGAAGADRRFTADGRCPSCGICEQVCPVENYPARCRPAGAIQAGPKTEKRSRYRHPEVKIEELTSRGKG